MIVLDIGDESGGDLYEALGLTREDVQAAKNPTEKVRQATRKVRQACELQRRKGDKDAQKRLDRVNEAEAILKEAKKREDYDKGLDSGKGASLEVLRVRTAAPPTFTDRAARFRRIEEDLRRAGLAQPVWSP